MYLSHVARGWRHICIRLHNFRKHHVHLTHPWDSCCRTGWTHSSMLPVRFDSCLALCHNICSAKLLCIWEDTRPNVRTRVHAPLHGDGLFIYSNFDNSFVSTRMHSDQDALRRNASPRKKSRRRHCYLCPLTCNVWHVDKCFANKWRQADWCEHEIICIVFLIKQLVQKSESRTSLPPPES